MANLIEKAQIIQQELDKVAVEKATSGWMELNSNLVKYTGGSEIKMPSLSMDGLGDYDRNKGFVDGSINFKFKTYEMSQDRGRRFTFDEHEVDETNFILTASTVMGEFQRTKVIPEIDAYRYSKISSIAIAGKKAKGGYTPSEATILKELYSDIAKVQDVIGHDTELVITMSTPVASILDMNDTLAKKLSVSDFKQGDVTLKVNSLNGTHPIIRVPSSRMKTSYIFKTGKTGQEIGGFEASSTAKDINWIISARKAPRAVSKTDKTRIFSPEVYQNGRMWAMDYRKFHELWIPENKLDGIFVSVKQALV